MKQVYHVSKLGCDKSEGSEQAPFLTVNQAAKVAKEGDTIIVHEGIYREWVKPQNGGFSEATRITYTSAPGEKVVIKGSEEVNNWQHVEENIWKVVLPNHMFGDYNPYEKTVDGDWLIYPKDWKVHTGDVYVNGKSYYEARTYEELKGAKQRDYFVFPWNGRKEYYAHPEDTIYQWFAEVEKDITTIYGNFQNTNPNEVMTEINVRKCCFYPDRVGVNYITFRGFEVAQAACHWAPPTGDQVGMIGAHWSKGWIIEDNIVHDAKCSAISIGKEKSTGNELSYKRQNKPGYHYQMESVFEALNFGWNKEKIGSHIVRNNVIFDCGQNAIVGHMGCAFSQIYGNHIYRIGEKHEYFGWEVAGIKLHAAIDTHMYGNCIHDCTLGFWMDWEAQGTRISRNLMFNNQRDGFIEVTHGPMVIDNNIFASKYSLDNHAQGTAFINNIFNGYQSKRKILDRATPYHLPHSTMVKGYAFVHSGDDRYYGNIFMKQEDELDDMSFYGTEGYNGYTASLEEYLQILKEKDGDHEKYFEVEQPIYANNNVYLGGAKAYGRENEKFENEEKLNLSIEVNGNDIYLEMNIPKGVLIESEIVNTEKLGVVRIVDTIYDTPEGNELKIDWDYTGSKRNEKSYIGPFSEITEGTNKIKVW